MEPKDYRELIRFTEEELMDYYKKTKQNPTPDCFMLLKEMLSGILKAETIVAMREEGGSSEGNGWYYQDGESYRRGRSNEGGQSGRRYSREGSNDGGQSGRRYSREGGGSNDGGQSGRRYSRDDGGSEAYRGNSYHGGGDEELYEYLKRKVRSEEDAGRRSAFEDMMRMLEK